VYAGSFFDDGYYRSSDRGASWTRVPVPWFIGLNDFEPHPTQVGVVYAALSNFGSQPRLFRSIDHGGAWASITGDLPAALPVNCVLASPIEPGVLYVGTDLGVYRSRDEGTSWHALNGNLPNVVVLDMHFHRADSTLRVATYGRGAWLLKLSGDATTAVDPRADARGFALRAVRPNPTGSTMTLDYRLGARSRVKLRIYDLSGRAVRVLRDAVEDAGPYTLRWDGADEEGRRLTSGIYLCRMEAVSVDGSGRPFTQTRKVAWTN
jgi:hypothetical protein